MLYIVGTRLNRIPQIDLISYGIDIKSSTDNKLALVLDIVKGELKEEAIASWLKENSVPLSKG